ncbi:MAG: DUF4352 domain-containing protein [Clostridia bacterium]|jgi:hypothetical protein|nr:DUF4352 domain-containing protein [Clostridia bacterium]
MKKQNGGTLIAIIFCSIVFIVAYYIIDTSKVDYEKISDVSSTYYIGDTVELGDFSVKLEECKTKKKGDSLGGYAAVDDEQWIAIYLTYTNKSGDEKSISKNIRLINGNGEELKELTFFYSAWGGVHLDKATLINGGSKTGFVHFRNTRIDNLENLTLQVSCNSYFDEESTFNFKLVNK